MGNAIRCDWRQCPQPRHQLTFGARLKGFFLGNAPSDWRLRATFQGPSSPNVLLPFTMHAGPHPDFQFKLFWQPRRMSCASGRRNRMKLKKFGRAALALAASAVTVLGMTSCTLSYTVGYLFVTGSQYNQIASYRIQNDNGALHPTEHRGLGRHRSHPRQSSLQSGNYVYVLNYGAGTAANPAPSSIALFSIGGLWCADVSDVLQPAGLQHQEHRHQRQLSVCAGRIRAGQASVRMAPELWRHLRRSPSIRHRPSDRHCPIPAERCQRKLPLYYFPVGTNPTWLP